MTANSTIIKLYPYDNSYMVLHSQHQSLLDSGYRHHMLGRQYMVLHSQRQLHLDSGSRPRMFDRQGMVLHSQYHFHLDYEFHQCMLLDKQNNKI